MLTPVLLKTLGEKHPRVASEAFKAFSSLLGALKPVKGQDWTESVYNEAIARLSNHATDAEVRLCAKDIIGDLWLYAPDTVLAKSGQEWEYVRRTTGRTDGAVKVVTRVAREADVTGQWVDSCVEWATKLLTKNGRTGNAEVFECLTVLLSRCVYIDWRNSAYHSLIVVGRYDNGVPPNLLRGLIPQLKTYVSATDISLHSQALSLFALLLQLSPKSTFPEVEREVLEYIYGIAYSPLTSGAALDAVLVFFGALVEADSQIATHVVSSLTRNTPEKPKEVSYPNVAKCVAQVVRSYHALAAGVIAEFSKNLKVRYTWSSALFHRLTLSSEACRSTGPFLVSPHPRGNWPFHVRPDQTNRLTIVDMLLAICLLSTTSSIAPSSSLHLIRKTSGPQQLSLQVSPMSFFSPPRNLIVRYY